MNRKFLTYLFIGVSLLLLCSSCTDKFYVPETQYVPEFTDAKQFEFRYSPLNRYEVGIEGPSSQEMKFAYSPWRKIGLLLGVTLAPTEFSSHGNATYGIGYYDKIDSTLSYAVYLIGEKGDLFSDDRHLNILTKGVTLLPSVRQHFQKFTLSYAVGVKRHKYYDIEYDEDRLKSDVSIEAINLIEQNNTLFQLEPALNFNYGSKAWRWNVHFARSINLNGSDLPRHKGVLAVGLSVQLGKKHVSRRFVRLKD